MAIYQRTLFICSMLGIKEMTFSRIFIITIFILIQTLNGCSQMNDDSKLSRSIPSLSMKDSKHLANDQDRLILYGHIATHTTEGAYYMERLWELSDKNSEQWANIYLDILARNEFYHLHNDAGKNLASLISFEEIIAKQDSLPENSIPYILSRMVYSTSQVIGSRPLELSLGQINRFVTLLSDENISSSDKVYFLNALYSCCFKTETGVLIDSLVRTSELDSNIVEHNAKLYGRYKNIKPKFDRLNEILTWKEMDKNLNEIEEFLQLTDPLLFYQILGFNPSTVLESKEFCQLKKETLLSILSQSYAGNQLFYASYINAFRPELLGYDFYTVRFLQKIMTKKEFLKFRNTFSAK